MTSSPLRYPGGKGQISYFIKQLIKDSGLSGGQYAEPYAGGAAVALELLIEGHVARIHINDISRPVYAFWHSVLEYPDELCRLITDTDVTVENWDIQKDVLRDSENADLLELGFATFFLNRTSHSGIMNGGIIGGRDQSGHWKIGARYYTKTLIRRIRMISKFRDKISLTRHDAVDFIRRGISEWPSDTLVYLDPPYYQKGKHLYFNYYKQKEHKEIAALVGEIQNQKWLVSYDNVPEIRKLYKSIRKITYGIGYSARERTKGSEVMFFGPGLEIPEIDGAMKNIRRYFKVAA